MNTTNRYHHVDGILPYEPSPWHTTHSTRVLTTLFALISLFSVFVSARARRNASSLSPSSFISPPPALHPLLLVLSFLPSLFLPENYLLHRLPLPFSSPHAPPLSTTPSLSLASTTSISATSPHGPSPPSYPLRHHHTSSSLHTPTGVPF